MSYETVFQADNPVRNLSFAAFGLVFVVVGALRVFRPEMLTTIGFQGLQGKPGLWFGWFGLVFASLWTAVAGIGIAGGNIRAIHDLKAGRCQVLEGPVENFRPLPIGAHGFESFSVHGVSFQYSDGVVIPGFNNTASHRGPIRQGLWVRLCERDGQILRLEVAH
jgi:hypothetical protein